MAVTLLAIAARAVFLLHRVVPYPPDDPMLCRLWFTAKGLNVHVCSGPDGFLRGSFAAD